METDAFNSLAINNFLASNKNQDWNWVAFDQDDGGRISGLLGFQSASEANRFCRGSNTTFDHIEQDFADANYRYMALDTLRKAFEQRGGTIDEQIDFYGVLEKLNTDGIHTLRSHDPNDIKRHISEGTVFPVEHDRVVIPNQDIDRFIVVGQHHDRQQVYEIGQSVQIIDTFLEKDQAEKCLKDQITHPSEGQKNDEYQLIGLYRGQEYKIDIDGKPKDYCGLILMQAFLLYEPELEAEVWKMDFIRSIEEPIHIRRFLYVQYDHNSQKWKFLDDQLKETKPNELKAYRYPQYFINEKFTIKQLEIMNEQSYEYVKDQLFYLGFGEEIAKPLREKMEQGLNEFTLNHTRDFGKDKTESVLHFSKGDDLQKDLTFFNRFDMTLKQEGKADLTQNFFVGQKFNYTLQERYNMMNGRFVYREQPKVEPKELNGETKMVPTGETYLAWKGLNFKESDQYGNFLPKTMFWKHEKEIVKYPIKEVAEPYDKNRLLASMQKGNKANVTIMRGDSEIKGTVVANPKMQRFDFYDENGQSLFVKQVEKQKVAKAETQDQSQQQSNVQDKKENSQKVSQPNPVQSESKEQTGQQNGQAMEKSNQKPEVTEEQKNSGDQRKRQGVKV